MWKGLGFNVHPRRIMVYTKLPKEEEPMVYQPTNIGPKPNDWFSYMWRVLVYHNTLCQSYEILLPLFVHCGMLSFMKTSNYLSQGEITLDYK